MDKNDKILVLVESPNKCATIRKILKDGGYKHAEVMASVGHITMIKDGGTYWNCGIEPTHKFKTNYVVIPGKQDVIKKLQKAVNDADKVFICSDPDREGEAIAWHLKHQLKIPESKYSRATFHEVTKQAVLAAFAETRKIDEDLVDAAKSRAIVDKMLGYRLTPIARTQVQAKSVGRCQSAGLKLIIEREDEINNFKVEKYFDLYLNFEKNKTPFKAKYSGTKTKKVDHLTDKENCEKIKKDCDGKESTIGKITRKEQKEAPKPPFTTSTFQQEANKVFGMSIDTAMSCAQRLFEGLNVGGEHIALITYIRTDDSSMSPDFAKTLGQYVKDRYGKEYYAPIKKGNKANENTQEAHECLRVINASMTPTELEKYISDNNLLKVYRLIWERTIMSSMAPAIIGDTQYDVYNGKHVFTMHSREVVFPGYRNARINKIVEESASKDSVVDTAFEKGEVLEKTKISIEEKATTPPKRYTEASFIKELDKRGIGRPSTFATIIKTILSESRDYCRLENKYITPTQKGISLSRFLDENFPDLINLHYTSELEGDLDKIATGKINYLDFLDQFYKDLEGAAKKVKGATGNQSDLVCPICGKPLVRRISKYGPFLACSGYPNCRYVLNSARKQQTKK